MSKILWSQARLCWLLCNLVEYKAFESEWRPSAIILLSHNCRFVQMRKIAAEVVPHCFFLPQLWMNTMLLSAEDPPLKILRPKSYPGL